MAKIFLFYFYFCIVTTFSCKNDQFRVLSPFPFETVVYDYVITGSRVEKSKIRYSINMRSCPEQSSLCVELITSQSDQKKICTDFEANASGVVYGSIDEDIVPGNFTILLSSKEGDVFHEVPITIKRNITIKSSFIWENYIKHYVHGEEVLAYSATLGKATTMNIQNVVIYMDIFPWTISIGSFVSVAPDAKFLLSCNGGMHRYDFITTSALWRIREIASLDGYKHDTTIHYGPGKRELTIGSDVWIGQGAKLINAVTIGHGAIIGAYAVVREDVPPYAIVIGNPAKILKYRFNETIINQLLQIKWWERFTDEEIIFEMPNTNDIEEFINYANNKILLSSTVDN